MKARNREKLSDVIWLAKGIGIILVVVGHCSIPGGQPAFWSVSREIIYSFHMPLFFCISGWLYGLSGNLINTIGDYWNFIGKKFNRLIVPYVSITILLLSAKYIAGSFFTLQHPITHDFYKYIILNPSGGFATLLWFIYALFMIFLLYPIFKYLLRNEWLILFVALALAFVPFPEAFCLNSVFHHLPFFAIGLHASNYDLFGKSTAPALFLSSLLLFVVCYLIGGERFAKPFNTIILGITGSLFCISLAFLLVQDGEKKFSFFGILKIFGMYSAGIYLLHTLVMGPLRIFLYQVLNVGPAEFIPAVFLIVGSGLVIPVAIQKYILLPNKFARRLILGVQ